MTGEALDRAARVYERLDKTERRRTSARLFATMAASAAVGIGSVAVVTDMSLETVATVAVVSALVYGIAAGLVASRAVALSPLWQAGLLDGLRVQTAVALGRPVRRAELAGLAVAVARHGRHYRALPAVQGILTVALVAMTWTRLAALTLAAFAIPLLLLAAVTGGTAINARRAEAANRALLES